MVSKCVLEKMKTVFGELMQCELMKMRYSTLIFAIASFLLFSSCQSEPKILAIAERQFIDIETMKPIEGGWVHFVWYGKPKPSGASTCKSAVLGRSGADGWFRNTAQDPSWQLDEMTVFFVPGYQRAKLARIESEPDQLMLLVEETDQYYGKMPGFEQRLREQGFVYHPSSIKDRFSYHWTKRIYRKDFPRGEYPQRYFIRYHGFPWDVGQNFSFLGRICDDPGAINIGLSRARTQYTDKLRSTSSTRFFCDSVWKGSPLNEPSNEYWVNRMAWVLSDPTEFWQYFKSHQGAQKYNGSRLLKGFDEAKRQAVCAWIMPHVEKVEAQLRQVGPPESTISVIPEKAGVSQ